MVSDKKIFHVCPYISLCKTYDPLGGAIFGPRGIILNKLGRGPQPVGDATYQISRLYAIRFQTRRFFYVFSYISLCKTCDPVGEAIFGPRGHNLNKHGRGQLGNATYQISRLQAIRFQTRRFFHAFTI